MPLEIHSVLIDEALDVERTIDTEDAPGVAIEFFTQDNRAAIFNRHQPAVEENVEIRRKQKTVVNVETFRVSVAMGPTLDMTGAEKLGYREAGDAASAIPEVEQAVAEKVLADALDHEAFCFRPPWQGPGPLVEGVEQLGLIPRTSK